MKDEQYYLELIKELKQIRKQLRYDKIVKEYYEQEKENQRQANSKGKFYLILRF